MRLPFYQCPSDGRVVAAYPYSYPITYTRSYFGCVGGKTRTAANTSFGDVYQDGLFGFNRWRRFADVRDGASNTFAAGERVHYAMLGLGPGYNVPGQGGPSAWWQGDHCYVPTCDPSSHSYGRGFSSAKWPINSTLSLATYGQDNEIPFGSFHSGGAHFVFLDGHVTFIGDAIDLGTYHALSTIAGGEVIPGSAY
jgi:prepilin-type processing-associated H-X9-DG protein